MLGQLYLRSRGVCRRGHRYLANHSQLQLADSSLNSDKRCILPFLELPDFYLCLPGSGICHQRPFISFLELPEFYICLPGSGIPDWFTYQGEESQLRIELPANDEWWNIAGFAVCAVAGERNVGEHITWSIATHLSRRIFNSETLFYIYRQTGVVRAAIFSSDLEVRVNRDEIE
ncbi:hypothetical protein GH714_015309 [Hevea brasiliensis]|uniref:C-JID domain-containing protein n=1 Tax=Hevea brasiliensis TaxID=3981 RepID=A0A6A6LXL8_HEVBR|nr:hypothetical protein GH714_015309 [Hevea brasiliensis]